MAVPSKAAENILSVLDMRYLPSGSICVGRTGRGPLR